MSQNTTLVYLEASDSQHPLFDYLQAFLMQQEALKVTVGGKPSRVIVARIAREARRVLAEQREQLEMVFVVVEGRVNQGFNVSGLDNHSDVIANAAAPVDEKIKPLPVVVFMQADQNAEAPQSYLIGDRPDVGRVVVIQPPFDPDVIREAIKNLVANPVVDKLALQGGER